MSQLQVTGEAKIRDIQGPVVANDGVITALDGAASQYVRGDGTLADFPTSSGGGSSVSYYLNSSVSQGTIGGVAYRELSKDPIIGSGTDIAISANGYVASYITDANDPDVVIVPGGNFNCEFYFSVNNNTGNPTTYAELYKYDGTTFTLLGTSSGVPESINQGTTIAPYYFAIPVATAALALTDRLAIRIYVNVDGRTVTLHTENGHLCQVVTTLSKGMVSLNNLTDQSQFITTGTSGTNFNIVSSGDTHTFNLPVASASNTGKLSSTDWSTFNNKQAAGNYVTLDTTQTITAYKTFSSTFGTQFDYGIYSPLTSKFDQGILFLKGSTPAIFTPITTNLYSEATSNNLVIQDENSKAKLVFNNSTQTYTLPAITGTLALLEGTQTFSGAKTFGSSVSINTGGQADLSIVSSAGNSSNINSFVAGVLKSTISTSATEFKLISAIGNVLKFQSSGNFIASLIFNNAADYSYTFPAATGTIALTSNLSSYLPLAGGTLTGDLTIAKADTLNVLTLSSTNTNVISFITSSVQKGEISVNGSNFQFNSATTNGYIFKNSASNNVLTITDAGVTTLIGALTGTSATFTSNVTIRPTTGYNAYFQTSGTSVRINYLNDALTTNVGAAFRATDYSFQDGAGSAILTLASTGAATFSGSVTASTGLTIGTLGSGSDAILIFATNASGAPRTIYYKASTATINVTSTGGTDLMTITNGGNVGIGTTAPSGALQVSNAGYAIFNNSAFSQTPLSTGISIGYNRSGANGESSIVWGAPAAGFNFEIASVTSGTITPRLTITNTGNVGIGTTAPQTLLSIETSGVQNTVSPIITSQSSGTTYTGMYSIRDGAGDQRGLIFQVYTANVGLNEKFRIASSGVATFSANVMATSFGGNAYPFNSILGNGTDASTSSIYAGSTSAYVSSIDVAGGNATNPNTIIFKTASTERMRITSGGAVCIGSTTPAGSWSNTNAVATFFPNGAYSWISGNQDNASSVLYIQSLSTTGTRELVAFGTTDLRGTITTDGSSVSYNTTSDYRLKTDLKDFKGLSIVNMINVYDYKWKDADSRSYGVLAHELQEILPIAVVGVKDGEKMQGVDYSKLVPILVKSIQELEARIKQLENK